MPRIRGSTKHYSGSYKHGYRRYPLVDHVADKVAAIIERYGRGDHPSTRFKDLVDLVAIAIGDSVDAGAQRAAIASEPSGAPSPSLSDSPRLTA